MNSKPRVLIVEDNEDLLLGLVNNLEVEGYEVSSAENGEVGLEKLTEFNPQLIILDIMMPKLNGFEFLKTLKERPTKPMILILSALGEEVDKVTGLKLGADDFLCKPFGLMELLARVEALLRRSNPIEKDDASLYHFNNVTVDCGSRRVEKSGEPVELTPKEFDLLVALLKKQGNVVSRSELMSEVWGYSESIESRTVDTHIGELRKKLDDDLVSSFITTIRKVGYRVESS